MIHCFIWDGVRVFAFRAFVIRRVLVSIDSTNNSNVRGIYSVKEIYSFCKKEKKKKPKNNLYLKKLFINDK